MTYKVFWTVLWPVYYHVPIYRAVDNLDKIDLKIIYFDDTGIKPYYEKEMGILRDHNELDLLSGYKYKFLKNLMKHNNDKGFFTLINPSIFIELLKEKPDTVIIQGYSNLSDWFTFIAAKFINAKIIFRGEAVLKGNEDSKYWKQRLKRFILQKFLKACDVVMYSCTGNKNYWKFYGVDESKMFPIPCAVDNNFFRVERKKYLSKKSDLKAELGINNDDFVVLFSARFTTRKRPLDLLNAIKKIDNKNITVLFVGDGLERSNMEKFSKSNNINAIFVGFQNQMEISKYYSISDVDIVISDYDPSPKAMNEAMNFELPIICTKATGTAYDLVTSGNGFLVDTGDIDTISEKIDYLNKNRTIAKKMGKKSLDIVNNWTIENDAYWIEKAVEYVMEKK